VRKITGIKRRCARCNFQLLVRALFILFYHCCRHCSSNLYCPWKPRLQG